MAFTSIQEHPMCNRVDKTTQNCKSVRYDPNTTERLIPFVICIRQNTRRIKNYRTFDTPFGFSPTELSLLGDGGFVSCK